MTAAVKEHIFEPFFTTKGVGKGTGLGLATVYGIVRQSGGHIEVRSVAEERTTFTLYFPAVREPAPPSPHVHDARQPLSGTETLLLVEDEESVRNLACHVLQEFGYRVLVANDGADALQIAGGNAGDIDILVTDVVMPGMSGRELAETLRPRYSNMKILYVSGYTDDAVVRHGLLHAEAAFLQKPYSPRGLAGKVRLVLDGR
jgi:two-component system cell cycle sensor histidine kinase/response regulator CckA